ncbi:hypothetical protein [Rhodococcus wratislaviensis]|uniref:hypothetical protein n=1 Tax=Rhodococcus wratislaviensis TaxID=44752 RepID=UPI00365B6C67
MLPMMPGMPERRSHDYVRSGVSSLSSAFNIADGTVISELLRLHRAVEFKKFLTAIDKAVPDESDVHLVGDNLATHKTWAVGDRLAKRLRSLHPDRVLLNQRDRAMVRIPDRSTAPPRCIELLQHGRKTFDQDLERPPEAVRLAHDRRGDPRFPRQIYLTNF